MPDHSPNPCPDCGPSLSRRDFARHAAAAVGGLAALGAARPARALTRPASPDSALARLQASLTAEQKAKVCRPFDDDTRKRVNANWAITDVTIEDDFDKDQQAIIEEIVRGVLSPEGWERTKKQMEEDYGGLGAYHVALFGEPEKGPHQFTLTGRHVTLRADGDSEAGSCFGGPIIYGHGAGDGQKGLPGNVYYYQTKKANEVFQALDGKQREQALIDQSPVEADVKLRGEKGRFRGINVGALSADQKALVESVLKTVLAPYSERNVEEAMALLKEGGGLDGLHMAFSKADDLGEDQEWDVWRVEGPSFVSHFRGSPHVHAYIHIGKKA